jgi:hypothetical protein
MEHPPYSPELAPNDLWLFPEVKSALKGRFQVTEEIQRNVTMALKGIPLQEFQKCFSQQHRWVKYIAARGEYLKGDPSQLSINYRGMLAVKSFRELHSHTLYVHVYIDDTYMHA